MTLLYIVFKAWSGIVRSRNKSVQGMLTFIKRARGGGARFWFERWVHSHAARRYENLKIAENKFKVCEMIIDLNKSYQILVKKKKAA